MRLAISVRCKGVSGIEEVAIKPRGISSRGFISLCAGIIILVNIAGAGCSSAQTQTVPVARVGVQWEADSRRIPERIRVWGGSQFPGIASNTVTRCPEIRNRPTPGSALECGARDRKSTRLNSSHGYISYAV